MTSAQLDDLLAGELKALEDAGRRKGRESVISGIVPAGGGRGPRYLLEGEGDKPFLRMNANNYLGLSLAAAVRAAEEKAVDAFGAGPGAVRFISGTWAPHVALEARLARFHGREAAMVFSSAYAAVMGTLPALITPETAVISDELNHNCIINATRLARPKSKAIYRHLDLKELEAALNAAAGDCARAVVVTDGIFSMRGDHAPLNDIMEVAGAFEPRFAEGVVVMVDDSHGVGAFGATGRGTEEFTDSAPVHVLVATLGKAFGVNGGYVAGSGRLIEYLREVSPFYVYSNPITPGEAAAAEAAVSIVDSEAGAGLLTHLRDLTGRFESGLGALGLETIPGAHPIVPLMVRDTDRTRKIVRHLKEAGILATGLNYPVVPKGDEEIRFQMCADHTGDDIDCTFDALKAATA